MPIGQRRAFEFVKEQTEVVLKGSSSTASRFSQPNVLDPARLGFGQNLAQRFIEAFENPAFRLARFSMASSLFFASRFGRIPFAALDQLLEFAGIVFHLDAAKMQHDQQGFDARGELQAS